MLLPDTLSKKIKETFSEKDTILETKVGTFDIAYMKNESRTELLIITRNKYVIGVFEYNHNKKTIEFHQEYTHLMIKFKSLLSQLETITGVVLDVNMLLQPDIYIVNSKKQVRIYKYEGNKNKKYVAQFKHTENTYNIVKEIVELKQLLSSSPILIYKKKRHIKKSGGSLAPNSFQQ